MTAKTIEDTRLLRIGRDDFYDLLADNSEITSAIFSTLVKRFRKLVEQTEFAPACADLQQMATLGRLLAGIVHEINTPIGSIFSNTDVMMRSLDAAASAARGRHPEVARQGAPHRGRLPRT